MTSDCFFVDWLRSCLTLLACHAHEEILTLKEIATYELRIETSRMTRHEKRTDSKGTPTACTLKWRENMRGRVL